MPHGHPAELVLGSAQLGLPYGAANRIGRPLRTAAVGIVQQALASGVTTIDTARAYGDSENLLGEALHQRSMRTITKLSPLTELASDTSPRDVRDVVDRSISESMVALRRGRLDCVLLHRAQQLAAFDGAIWQRLLELQRDGTIGALGVSVQSVEEARKAIACDAVHHIQLPFNLLDWRWRESGVIDSMRSRSNLTVHVRSVFLQGILASSDPLVWPEVAGVDVMAMIHTVQTLARTLDRESAADLCLAFVRAQDWIDGVVVGMETEDQLRTNLRLFGAPPLSIEECEEIEHRILRVPIELLDPAQWPRRN